MWFRTKEDYVPVSPEEVQDFIRIKRVKKGVPVFLTNIGPMGTPEFSFLYPNAGPVLVKMKRLDTLGVGFPVSCVGEGREIFCADIKEFFGVKGLAENVHFCLGCGKPLLRMREFPYEEVTLDPNRYYDFRSK